jgi:imidazolonepropionase-like amidohydrolase
MANMSTVHLYIKKARLAVCIGSVLCVFISVLPLTAWGKTASLVIEDVTVIDGTGARPLAHVSVLVEEQHITRVVPGLFHNDLKSGAHVIDGRGKYLIPGLMDVHVHLSGGTSVSEEGLLEMAADYDMGAAALHSFLYSGVTTILDVGNNPDFIYELRDRERAGKLVSPRIFAAGAIVTYPGSHGASFGDSTVDRWPDAIPTLDRHIDLEPDMVKFTLEERGWGARPMIPLLPVDLLQNMVEYYNDFGIRTTVHTSSERRARQAIFAGVDTLAHPVIQGPITPEFALLMAAKRIPMASTLTIGENYSRVAEHPEFLDQALYRATLTEAEIERIKGEDRAKYVDSSWTWWMKIMTPVAQNNLKQINDAGGIVALGTDASNGAAVHREMELLVDAGMSNLDVIRCATLNAARFLGRADDLGTITVGKLADMVLLNANPEVDINNVKEIYLVIKNGTVVDRSRLNLPVNK